MAIAALPSRRRRAALILALWIAAAGLIIGQYLLLRYLGALDRQLAQTDGHLLLPSPWWRLSGTAAPLLLAGTALALQRRWLDGFWSGLAGFAWVAFLPFAATCLLLAHCLGTWTLESLRLPGGDRVTIAVDEGGADVGFILFEDADPGGFVWRQVSELDDIDGGPFARRPSLVAAPNGAWLLVRRAGIWTDAFRLVDGRPERMPLFRGGDADDMRLRSARIAALTGLRP